MFSHVIQPGTLNSDLNFDSSGRRSETRRVQSAATNSVYQDTEVELQRPNPVLLNRCSAARKFGLFVLFQGTNVLFFIGAAACRSIRHVGVVV